MNRKQSERTFRWKISGEIKFFEQRILKMKKKEIFQVAYQIDTIICIYQVLKNMSACMEEETLKAGIAMPDILVFLYERWVTYEDAHMEDIQYCLNEEMAKILEHYGEKRAKEKGSVA